MIKKECKKYGLTDFILEGRGNYRCRQCRTDGVVKRRREVKKKAVAALGGKCSICGYDKSVYAMDFHHVEGKKEFGIGSGDTLAWKKIEAELKKCILVCSNCHRELHAPKE